MDSRGEFALTPIALLSLALAGAPCSTDAGEALEPTASDAGGSTDAGSAAEPRDAGTAVDAGAAVPDDDCALNDVDYVGLIDHEIDGPDPVWTVAAHGVHLSTEPTVPPDKFIRFAGPSLCSLGGEVTQEVFVPGPCGGLVPAINFNMRTSGGGGGGGMGGLRVEGTTMPYGGFNDEISCLGDAVFGRAVTVELFGRAYGVTEGCGSVADYTSADLTRAMLVGAATCPAPGEVAELSTWRFFRNDMNVPVEAQALFLATPGACDSDTAFAPNEGGVSIPLAMENPALLLDLSGSIVNGARLEVGFGLGSLTSIVDARVCLPRSRRGYVLPLGLMLRGQSGMCSNENGSAVTIGGINVIDDPSCASDDVGFLDPELVDPRLWVVNGRATATDGARPGETATGAGAIALSATTECEGGQALLIVDVPKRDGLPRSMVVAYSLAGTETARLVVEVPATNTTARLPDTDGALVEERLCIDPFIGGDLASVSITLDQPPDVFCDLPSGSLISSAVIESVRLMEDAECPAPPL